jgi:putative transposase
MKKGNTDKGSSSRIEFEQIEAFVREKVQGYIQDMLEEEVEELLGRSKWERKGPVDPENGYRNGYGKPRRLTLQSGTVTVRRPRVRSMEERFESRVLPLFVRRTKEVGNLIPELYLHGLSGGDFNMAIRGLLGENAPLSANTVARLKDKWKVEHAAWVERRLDGLEIVYCWADGVYVKAGLEKEKAAVLVIIGALSDGTKVILYLGSGYRESKESWKDALRSLKGRGVKGICLMVADGNLGLWSALPEIYPETKEQRCWNHKIVNVLDKVPKKSQTEARGMLAAIPYSETRKAAEEGRVAFEKWCNKNGFENAAANLSKDWDRMVAFYSFPKEHWRHLRTTNPVESPFASLRLRTDAAKRFKKVDNATAMIWKLLMVAEKTFRKCQAPELMKMVFCGVEFEDGVAVEKSELKKEADAA